MKKIVREFISHPRWRVGVVSGRDLATVRKKTGLNGLIYAGNHGYEIQLNGGKIIVHPAAKKLRGLLRTLCADLKTRLKKIPGALVENKIYSASLHTRTLSPRRERDAIAIARRLLAPHVQKRRLRLTQGKKVLEIRPPAKWDKGKAVLYILKKTNSGGFPVYIGDDRTDEDAFKVLRKKGLGIRVGRSARTHAPVSLKGIRQMPRLLNELLAAISGPTC